MRLKRAPSAPATAEVALAVVARFAAGYDNAAAWRPAVNQGDHTLTIIQTYCETLGASPQRVLMQLLSGLEASEQAAAERQIALSGPRATAILLAGLPVCAVAIAALFDSRILGRYFDGGIGTAAFVLGAATYCFGILWIRVLTERASRRADPQLPAALAADLIAAGMDAGADLATAIDALGQATETLALRRLVTELRRGTTWRTASAMSFRSHPPPTPIDPELGRVLAVCRLSWEAAVAPELLLQHTAHIIRTRQSRNERTRAAQLGVKLTLPLGLALLPAFILLLIVPLILSGLTG